MGCKLAANVVCPLGESSATMALFVCLRADTQKSKAYSIFVYLYIEEIDIKTQRKDEVNVL